MPIAGIAGMKNVTLSSAPEMVATLNKSNRASAGLQDAACGDNKLVPHRDLQTYVDKHAGFELQPGIRKDDPHLGRPGIHIHLRVDKVHTASKRPARIGIHSERCGSADLYTFEVVLEDLCLNPNCGKVGDGVEAHFRLNGNTGQSIALGDVARDWRIDVGQSPFVHSDTAGGANLVCD